MKGRFLGLVAVGLLAGPTAANAVNIAPEAFSASYTILADAPFVGFLGASDADGSVAGFSLVTGPAHGVLTVTAITGAFVYDPNPAYLGPDNFTFRAMDNLGALSDVATISFRIVESLATVPEPGSLALLGLGLTALALSRKRKAA